MLLRNFDFANLYFDYMFKTEREEIASPKINGWYKFVNGSLSALLVMDGNLYFIYEEEQILLKESFSVSINKSYNSKSEFNLIDGNNVVVKFLYHLPNNKFDVSPFEYIDQDDFKWGEFIAKIVNDKERKRNFVMNLMG